MRAKERDEISMLKKEKMNLLKLIDKKNEEISLQSEVKGSNVVTNSLNSSHSHPRGDLQAFSPGVTP